MVLPQTGFDSNSTYFEHNLNSKEIPNIFIHGVGLDNKMWLPQKKYFRNKQVLFYDLLNHGNSKKGYSERDCSWELELIVIRIEFGK